MGQSRVKFGFVSEKIVKFFYYRFILGGYHLIAKKQFINNPRSGALYLVSLGEGVGKE